jgi:hypothetical protein
MSRILRRFGDRQGQELREIWLSWEDEVREEIAVTGALQEVSLNIETQAVKERILLQPASVAAITSEAQLCRPQYDTAQAFSIEHAGPIVGVDLWARPLSRETQIRAVLVPDDQGRPGLMSGAELAHTNLTLQDPQAPHSGAQWLALDFDTPRHLTGSTRWWVVITVQAGELLWFLGNDPPAGVAESRYRLGEGPWLQRGVDSGSVPSRWAVSRLRVADDRPAPPLEAELVISSPSQAQQTVNPLQIDDNGRVAWYPKGEPLPVQGIALRFRSIVAIRLRLSALQIVYRPNELPSDGDATHGA